MKKILILPILIAPIMAHATDPVGPAHVNSGAVVATAPAPYATAREETGDTTNVVSASYVKGAYNDAISAINNVADKVSTVEGDLSSLSDFVNNDIEDEIDGKQDKLVDVKGAEIGSNEVWGMDTMADFVRDGATNYTTSGSLDNTDSHLVTAGGVIMAIRNNTIKAVTSWGNDNNPDYIPLTPLGF